MSKVLRSIGEGLDRTAEVIALLPMKTAAIALDDGSSGAMGLTLVVGIFGMVFTAPLTVPLLLAAKGFKRISGE